MLGGGFHVEVNFSRFPLLANFGNHGGDEAKERGFIWEKAGDASAAFNFLIHAFQSVGSAESFLVCEWQTERGEPLGQVFFHPGGEFWGAFGIEVDELLELVLGGGKVWAVEEAADGAGDLSALIQPRDMGLGILLEVELAALPGDGWENGGACGFEADVVVADNELDAG